MPCSVGIAERPAVLILFFFLKENKGGVDLEEREGMGKGAGRSGGRGSYAGDVMEEMNQRCLYEKMSGCGHAW